MNPVIRFNWPRWVEICTFISHFLLALDASVNILLYCSCDKRFFVVVQKTLRSWFVWPAMIAAATDVEDDDDDTDEAEDRGGPHHHSRRTLSTNPDGVKVEQLLMRDREVAKVAAGEGNNSVSAIEVAENDMGKKKEKKKVFGKSSNKNSGDKKSWV